MEIHKSKSEMTTAYIRFSTDKQDETQQVQAIKEWTEPKGISIDAVVKDEGVSGGVSYRDRNLYKLVKKMAPGDVLIVTEISRLGRSMSDLNVLVNEELKPRGVRLVVIKMGLDLDCANLKAMDQMILFAFGFAAEVEKEMIVQRTQSALDARKELIKKDGGFISKKGRYCTKFGPRSANAAPGNRASCQSKQAAAQAWREKSRLYRFVKRKVKAGWTDKEIVDEARAMFEDDPTFCKMKGGPLDLTTCWIWRKEIEPFI